MVFVGLAMDAKAQPSFVFNAANPALRVPIIKYESVFASYRAFEKSTPAGWISANDADSGSESHASHQSHDAVPMTKVEPSATSGLPAGSIVGVGVVRSIDKAAAKIELTHEAIAALRWPPMTMLFRLKSATPAEASAAVGIAVRLLSSCATLSTDGGFGAVETLAKDRLGKETARAGNFSNLTYLREQTFYAEVVALFARAKQMAAQRLSQSARNSASILC